MIRKRYYAIALVLGLATALMSNSVTAATCPVPDPAKVEIGLRISPVKVNLSNLGRRGVGRRGVHRAGDRIDVYQHGPGAASLHRTDRGHGRMRDGSHLVARSDARRAQR